jgi:integrase/recombinase XerD
LLLRRLEARTHRSASELDFADLDASAVLGFLGWLEKDRGNCIRTRNARLAAIRSFAHYASTQEPSFLTAARQIRLIPQKRFRRPLLRFLSREEVQAILDTPDVHSWSGRRDRALFATMYNTGARVSELIAARLKDLNLQQPSALALHGKGRKERVVLLWKQTTRRLREWIREGSLQDDGPLFPGRFGAPLTRSGVEERLRRAVRAASVSCPSLARRSISPHTLRHATAMHMLQSGVDITVIPLWLGHESPATTHQYIEANLEMKRAALDKLGPPTGGRRVHPRTDKLLEFLRTL